MLLSKLSAKVDAHMKDLNEFYDRVNTEMKMLKNIQKCANMP